MLTHFNNQGRARMVDVTEKAPTHRRAVAAGEILVSPGTMAQIRAGTLKKGDVLAVAQVAGEVVPLLFGSFEPVVGNVVEAGSRLFGGNLIADLLYGVVDPKIRARVRAHSRKGGA